MDKQSYLQQQIVETQHNKEYLTKKASKKFSHLIYPVLLGAAGSIALSFMAVTGGALIPPALIKPAFVLVYGLVITPWLSYAYTKIASVVAGSKLKKLKHELSLANKENSVSTRKVQTQEVEKSQEKQAEVKKPSIAKAAKAQNIVTQEESVL